MKVHLKKTRFIASRGRFLILASMLAAASLVVNISMPNSAHAAVGSVSQYNVPLSGEFVYRIAVGPDNNIWYTAYGPTINTYIGKLTTSGSFSQYGNRTVGSRYPEGISKGSDGNIWYSEQYTVNSVLHYRIVNMTPTGTVLGQYNVPSDVPVVNMTLGPDGNVWFTETGNRIGKVTTSGSIAEYSISVGGTAVDMTSITTGPDGNLWFTTGRTGSTVGNAVGKITTAGTYTVYPISIYGSYPLGITTGPDGNLWFTESTNQIGKITTSGTITQYSSIPTANAQPTTITAGSDGALWFTEHGSDKIGRITTSGTVTEYSVPGATANSLNNIVTGPDDAVWFTIGVSQIGRMATELTSQTISFTSTAPTNAIIDGPTYTPAASATSSLPVVITVDSTSSGVCSIDSSGKVSFQGAGTCTIDANQAGNADYNPATQVQQSFTVLPVDAGTSVGLSCPATAHIGDAVTCTITVTNDGPAAADNATLTALVSSALSDVSITGGTLSGQNITWTTPSLASGDSKTITVSGIASTASKTQFNAALLQTSPDPDTSNNLANSTLVISE